MAALALGLCTAPNSLRHPQLPLGTLQLQVEWSVGLFCHVRQIHLQQLALM